MILAMVKTKNAEAMEDLLRGVSRSFYLSLRILPVPVRKQISLAYLLARASDTVADTKAVSRDLRLDVLRRMQSGDFKSVPQLAAGQALPAERMLLERLDECAAALAALEPGDRALISGLLYTIISGQIADLERFPESGSGPVVAIKDDAGLDDYTYLVAGCVGEFWTKICAAHLSAFSALEQQEMLGLGIRFGQGLQLVNILRDMAADLRLGRCYLPLAQPERLLDPAAFPEIAAAYQRWLDKALDHLDSGWRYALRVPRSLWRVRLACIWPSWIGLGTVALMRRSNPLDPAQRVMVPQV
ncbi:MAG: squalene/phytoene synthase family protein, partial [Elusimicrobiota bacterium]